MRTTLRSPLFSLLAMLVLAACGDIGTEPVMVPVASVAVSPDTATLEVGQTRQLAATPQDTAGNPLSGRGVTWTSSDTTVATISATGMLTALRPGVVEIKARSEAREATATITVVAAPLRFASISAGGAHTCGITTENIAYCWGNNGTGQLGTSDTLSRVVPRRVSGSFTWRSITAGFGYTCGITVEGTGYCWGNNTEGQLGNGTTSRAFVPVQIAGSHSFQSLSTAAVHTCGTTATGEAFCWGHNTSAELGDGTTTSRKAPVPVAGGFTFRSVAAGSGIFAFDGTTTRERGFTCGIRTDGAAYCWGANYAGQLGTGGDTVGILYGPRRVAMQGPFKSVTLGTGHACGLIPAGGAHCWGSNSTGQLGNGKEGGFSNIPTRITGPQIFTGPLSAGRWHTCGIATDGNTYCWGDNQAGQIGNGKTADALYPAAVSGGINFVAVDAGSTHTCAIATTGLAYCWGNNVAGQLGNGSTDPSSYEPGSTVPVPVVGPR